ncbi:hypothetical protein DIPPA_32316 [Diplonema papillatum]|nr:hypothetical protein DIPPA_32316 [Diplonema papillatum]
MPLVPSTPAHGYNDCNNNTTADAYGCTAKSGDASDKVRRSSNSDHNYTAAACDNNRGKPTKKVANSNSNRNNGSNNNNNNNNNTNSNSNANNNYTAAATTNSNRGKPTKEVANNNNNTNNNSSIRNNNKWHLFKEKVVRLCHKLETSKRTEPLCEAFDRCWLLPLAEERPPPPPPLPPACAGGGRSATPDTLGRSETPEMWGGGRLADAAEGDGGTALERWRQKKRAERPRTSRRLDRQAQWCHGFEQRKLAAAKRRAVVPRVPGLPASTGAGAHVLGRTRPFKGHWCDQHPYSALQRPPFPDTARMVNAYRKAGRAVAGKITGEASRPIAPFISSYGRRVCCAAATPPLPATPEPARLVPTPPLPRSIDTPSRSSAHRSQMHGVVCP